MDGSDVVAERIYPGAVDPAAVGKTVKADEQRIPCKRRSGSVRGITETERPQRQNLP